jgi:hypothetical protein
MTSEERKRIEQLIGRGLTAQEIGQGSIKRKQDATLRRRIAAANEERGEEQPWHGSTLDHDGTKPKRETRATAFKRLRQSQLERVESEQAAADRAAKLATDSVYLRMNRVSENALERARWDESIPQSQWELLLSQREAAKNDDRPTFLELNKQHTAYVEGVTNEKQTAIDTEIKRLQTTKKSLNEDRFEEPLPTPEPTTYSHIRRASGAMQFVNKADGEIFEYDPKVPHAKELAQDRLAEHQAAVVGKYGEPIPFAQ